LNSNANFDIDEWNNPLHASGGIALNPDQEKNRSQMAPRKRQIQPAPQASETEARSKTPAILKLLDELYPDAGCSLTYADPLQLLVATILSAQCTDERVNQVTPGLFSKYPHARSFAEATIEELEADIRSTGFFRNKARNIQGCCRILHERYGGRVPEDLETLVQLPGIGRKTANVVLGNSFGIPGIVVDTHVGRVSQRIGLTKHKDPEKIERDLMALLPEDRWVKFCHQIILLGRQICQSRKPRCEICPLRPFCDHGMKQAEQA
jgi:endonuclease III